MITTLLVLICFVIGIDSFNVTTADDARKNYNDWANGENDKVSRGDSIEYVMQYANSLIDSVNFGFNKRKRSIDLVCGPIICDDIKRIFGLSGYAIEETDEVVIGWQTSTPMYLWIPLFSGVGNIVHSLARIIKERKRTSYVGYVRWKGSAEECDEIGNIFRQGRYDIERNKIITVSW